MTTDKTPMRKKRIERITTQRACPQHIPGECGSDSQTKIPCTRKSFARCKENIVVKLQENKPKSGSSYIAKRNERAEKVRKNKRRK